MTSKIEFQGGKGVIVIDGKVYEPYMFRSFRPMPSNLSLFHRAGIRLYQMLVSGRISTLGVPYSNYGDVWVDEDRYDFTAFDTQMAMFKKFAPEGKFMIMLELDAPTWYLEKHPEADDGYVYLGKAVLDEAFLDAAEKYAKAFIRYAEDTYGEDIFAYAYSMGHCTEWFDYPGYYEPSERQREDYRRHFGNEIPTTDELCDVTGICMREPTSNEVTYRKHACGNIPRVIKRFAKVIKEEMEYKKILGTFYGYTVNASPGYQICVSSVGYESVWSDENIDMIFAPTSYSRNDDVRELTGASTYQCLVDSLRVNNKLYLHEIDHRTHLAGFALDNGKIIESYPDAYTTIEMLRRDLCTSQCKGSALWWFDFLGGYYNCPELEDELKKETAIISQLVSMERESVSEIAVFADPFEFNLLKEHLNLTVDYVRYNLNNLHKCGAPYEVFNLSDITRINLSRYKMLVFLYAPKITDEVRKIIDSTPDKLKVFIHLPGVLKGEKYDLSAAENVVNMTLSEKSSYENAVFDGERFGFHTDVLPIYSVSDNGAKKIADYESGECAVAIKGDRAYSGVGKLPPALWRLLAKEAGVFIYTEKNAPVYGDSRFIACQFPENGVDSISVKSDGIYKDMFTGKRYEAKGGALEFEHYEYQMMMFVKED